MNFIVRSLIAVFVCMTIAPSTDLSAADSLNTELTRCAVMSRDLQRLDCYDRLSGKVSSFAEEALPAKAITAKAISAVPAAKPSSFGLKEVEKTPVPSSSPEFGLKIAEEETIQTDVLNTSIAGEFSGWRKNDILTMSNGQVWKVTDRNARLYYKAVNPKVTITRTGFGSFRISLDGENQSTLVSRVK
jgi:hypothetical protein